MALVFLMYALFASIFIIEKTCFHYSQPLFLVGSRMFTAGLIMLLYQYYFYPKDFKFNRADLWKFVCLAIFNIYMTNVLEVWALRYMTAFKTCFIYSLSPFLAALLSYFIFREKLSRYQWIGLVIGCIGISPLLFEKKLYTNGELHFDLALPELAMLGAVVSSVYGWILMKQLIHHSNYSAFLVNGFSMLVGGTISLGHSLLVEEWNPIPVNDFQRFFECFVLILVISNLICYNLYGHLLKRYSATFMSFAGFTTPLFTALFGWVYLAETPTLAFVFSIIIVFCGLLIFSKDELHKGKLVLHKN